MLKSSFRSNKEKKHHVYTYLFIRDCFFLIAEGSIPVYRGTRICIDLFTDAKNQFAVLSIWINLKGRLQQIQTVLVEWKVFLHIYSSWKQQAINFFAASKTCPVTDKPKYDTICKRNKKWPREKKLLHLCLHIFWKTDQLKDKGSRRNACDTQLFSLYRMNE